MNADQATALTAALTALANAIGTIPAAAAAPNPNNATNLHEGDTPYNIDSRSGLTALREAASPLETKFDGSTATLPNFIIGCQQMARMYGWNNMTIAANTPPTPTASNIIIINGKNLFDNINSITLVELQTAHANRADARAKQNAQTFYTSLTLSLTGNLHSNFFSNPKNIPTLKDGPTFFKQIMDFTTVNSLPTAVATNDEIRNLNPVKFQFDIIKINTELARLFVLQSCGAFNGISTDPFKILMTIQTYDKIKRPQEWSTAVSSWNTQYNEGTLTDPQVLFLNGTTKYNELKRFTEEYRPSTERLDDSVVAMLSKIAERYKKKETPTNPGKTKKGKVKEPDSGANEGDANLPPFVTHKHDHGKNYKEGDKKDWNGKPYYYHVATTHRDNKRWFQHLPSACMTCRNFKEAQANEGEKKNDDDNTDATSALSDLTSNSSVETLLSQAYDLLENTEGSDAHQTMLADLIGMMQES